MLVSGDDVVLVVVVVADVVVVEAFAFETSDKGIASTALFTGDRVVSGTQ